MLNSQSFSRNSAGQKGIFKVLKGKNLQPRLLYLARISLKIDGEIKSFSDKPKLREFRITKPAVKKAECQRTDAFELWCWRRLLRVPWTARRSNQSILKEISPGCFLEGLMLKMKLQYFGHLMQRVGSLEKTLMLGRIGGRRRRG